MRAAYQSASAAGLAIAGARGAKSSVLISKSWRPDPSYSREEIWFDDVHRLLYADFQQSCNTCLRIRTWSDGLTTSRWNPILQCWYSEVWGPGIPLPLQAHGSLFDQALLDFAAGIPANVKRALRPFSWRQFILLKVVRRCPQTPELIESNAMLAWLLADTLAAKEIPIVEGCAWVFKKRREILDFCGVPGSESAVRALAKIEAESYTRQLFYDVKRMVTDSELLTKVSILPAIPASRIQLISRNLEFFRRALSIDDSCATAVWEEIGETPARSDAIVLWNDTTRVAESIDVAAPVKRMHAATYS
jgi:hypothetical protein